MNPIKATYMPDPSKEIVCSTQSRTVTIVQLIGSPEVVEAIFIDADRRIDIASIDRFSECSLIIAYQI